MRGILRSTLRNATQYRELYICDLNISHTVFDMSTCIINGRLGHLVHLHLRWGGYTWEGGGYTQAQRSETETETEARIRTMSSVESATGVDDTKARIEARKAVDKAARTRAPEADAITINPDKKAAAPADFALASTRSSYESAVGMAAAIQAGEATSRGLVERAIARIQLLNDKINAVVVRSFEHARRRADEADAATKAGKSWGRFHGVPMTLKEANATKGFRSTFGGTLGKYILPVAKESEVTVLRLLGAGVIVLGFTNLPNCAMEWQTNCPVYGLTLNPWDTSRTPGGSSGGAAAAMVAGFTPFELGSDIAGSIRIPAALCGLVGHCPTAGLLPYIMMAVKETHKAYFLARQGPMARSVDDVQSMLEVLVGDDDGMAPLPRPDPTAHASLAGYRVALWRSHPESPPGKAVAAGLDAVAAALGAAGAKVVELEPSALPYDGYASYKLFLSYLGEATRPDFYMFQRRELWARFRGKALRGRGAWTAYDDTLAKGLSATDQEERRRCVAKWQAFFSDVDVVVCPSVPCEAWTCSSKPTDLLTQHAVGVRPFVVDGESRPYNSLCYWTHLPNLIGAPTTAFPTTRGGPAALPIGLQAFGAEKHDLVVLDFVKKLMAAMGTEAFSPPAGFKDEDGVGS